MKNNTDMDRFIPKKWGDKIFFFAEEVFFSKNSGWHIIINPANCLVGMESFSKGMPNIFEIRSEKPQNSISEEGFSLRGRILLSAGVIFSLNNKLVLFQRDEKAPVDPLKWTTPAGRLDKTPLFCALKEFYEELIAFDQTSRTPIFFCIPDLPYEKALRMIYANTLKRKGYLISEQKWQIIQCRPEKTLYQKTQKLSVRFGYETIEFPSTDFLPFYDKQNNTLEIMLPFSADSIMLNDVQPIFEDGEYQRINKLYEVDDFLSMSDDILVNSVVFIKQQLKTSRSL